MGIIKMEGFVAELFGLSLLWMMLLLYLLISNSLMNRLDNENRWEKSSACVSLTVFCFLVDKLIIAMGVN